MIWHFSVGCRRWLRRCMAVFFMMAGGMAFSAGVGPGTNEGVAVQGTGKRLPYPTAKRDGTSHAYHGVSVADPYQWMEGQDPDLEPWLQAEERLAKQYFDGLADRARIQERLKAFWNFERYGGMEAVGDDIYYFYNSGLEPLPSLYRLSDGMRGTYVDTAKKPGELILDGTKFYAENDGKSISDFVPSKDGRYLALMLALKGSDWREIWIYDLQKKAMLADRVQWVKFSGVSWKSDGSGFYYSRYPEPTAGAAQYTDLNRFHHVRFHALGQPATADAVVQENKKEEKWWHAGYLTDDNRYLIVSVGRSTENKNLLHVRDLQTGSERFFDTGWKYSLRAVGNDGSLFYFVTNHEADNNKIIAFDVNEPFSIGKARVVVPESRFPIQSVQMVENQLVVFYLKDAATEIRKFSLQGEDAGLIPLPGIGSAGGFSGLREDAKQFYQYQSFGQPPQYFIYDVASGKSELFHATRLKTALPDIEVVQEFFPTKDGREKVPLFIIQKKGMPREGNAPLLLYGYGGFNVSLTPSFSPKIVAWVQEGGRYVIANLRGGGEYGEKWHRQGMRGQKQNVFDDFIGAAEYLIGRKYSSREHIAISGGSNGGLLTAAVANQRPDLFKAVVTAVGVHDMLKYHKFTIGYGWAEEYGTSDDAADFKTLIKYSPVHNVKKQAYPAVLVVTSDHDDRVVPAHSYKLAAELQHNQIGPAPVLLRLQRTGGHGGSVKLDVKLEEQTDELTFLLDQLKPRSGS